MLYVTKNDVSYSYENGILTIAHTNGGNIIISGWNVNPLSKIVFSNGAEITGGEITMSANSITKKTVNWALGSTKTFTTAAIGDMLQINGYKENDFVITKNTQGQLILTDAKDGTLTITDWSTGSQPSIAFVATDYNKVLTSAAVNATLFNIVTLSDNQNYSAGADVHQEFAVSFSDSTNVVINSVNGVEDRIRFTNNWSVDNTDLQVHGDDLYIKTWDNNTRQEGTGQVVIKNYMNSTVKTIEFGEMTFQAFLILKLI